MTKSSADLDAEDRQDALDRRRGITRTVNLKMLAKRKKRLRDEEKARRRAKQ